jgi:signal transduction histidine kinase/ActR/RegA family two-component response regulator
MTSPPPNWSSQQLTEFLAALYDAADEHAAGVLAVERITEGLDAEIGALVRDGRVVWSIGFPPDLTPADDLRALAEGRTQTLEVEGLGSCLGLVVPVDDGTESRVVVARYGSLPFLPDEVSLAQGIGRVLALTLRVFRVAEAERRQREQAQSQAALNDRLIEALETRQALLERLARVQRSITSGAGRERLFESIVRGAAELLDDEMAALMIRDADDRSVLAVVATAGQDELTIGARVPVSGTLTGQAAEEGSVSFDEDFQASAADRAARLRATGFAEAAGGLERLKERGVRAAIAVPLHERGRSLGSVVVGSLRKGRCFEAEEREVLLAFGEHASLALTDALRIEARRARDAQKVEQRYEARLRQAQRLESVGQLAGGIAHDFNNLLVIILNYARFVMEELDADTSAWSDVRQIARAAERASDLTKQLLLFSRRGVFHPRVVDPAEVVAEVEGLLRRTLTENIQVSTRVRGDLPKIEADPTQLEQVLLNLAVNSRDAMPGGGVLRIDLSEVRLDSEDARAMGLEDGAYVRLVVSDTGRGMSQYEVEHAFEPFFTTKPKGEGTGLGLATVFGIVTQADGAIVIDSDPGEGTTVTIHIPATDKPAPAFDGTAVPSLPDGRPATILVVEDEEAVRSLACRILSQHGYRVIEASGPENALSEWERHAGGVDLLLTDVVMPAMSGTELASRLASRDPDLAQVFMSGYADDVVLGHGLGDGSAQLLAKPFTADQLLAAVRRSLEEHVSV